MENIKLFEEFLNESNKLNEGEILVWNEVIDDFHALMNKLDDIGSQTTDPKWRKAILSISAQLDKVSNNLNKYDTKLGAIPTNESESLNESGNKPLPFKKARKLTAKDPGLVSDIKSDLTALRLKLGLDNDEKTWLDYIVTLATYGVGQGVWDEMD